MHKEQIEYFSLVYQVLNFSAAAKMIPMSPQGLAKSIHSLEAELGVPLFTDNNGALTPTAYAEEFLQFANNWGINLQTTKEAFRRIQALERREIRLGTSLGIIGFMGPKVITDFEKQHPEIKISYNELNDVYCEEGLLRGTYDFAFTLYPYEKSFITTELYAAQAYLWFNSRKENFEGTEITIADLKGKNLALPGKDFKIYETIIDACKAQDVNLGQIFTSNEIFWLYELVAEGKSTAFALPHLVDLPVFSHNKDVKALPLQGVPWRFGLSYLSSRKLQAHEQLFIEHCRNYVRKL